MVLDSERAAPTHNPSVQLYSSNRIKSMPTSAVKAICSAVP